MKLHSQRSGRSLCLAQHQSVGWRGGTPEDSHTGELGNDLLEQRQAFRTELRVYETQPCNIAAGSRDAGDNAALYTPIWLFTQIRPS